MQLGALLPLGDISGEPAVIREYAQAAEAAGYDFLEAPDHVLGANPASHPNDERAGAGYYQDPFVLFGYLAGVTPKLGFSTGVLILPQRQTALVAKQAACLDVLCGGRFRLGIGVGWNEIEFVGLNENFHNRGRRSAEQVRVMQRRKIGIGPFGMAGLIEQVLLAIKQLQPGAGFLAVECVAALVDKACERG